MAEKKEGKEYGELVHLSSQCCFLRKFPFGGKRAERLEYISANGNLDRRQGAWGEERGLIKDLTRHGQLAVAWDRHGSPVPRWTLTHSGLDKTPALLALQSTGYPPPPARERGSPWSVRVRKGGIHNRNCLRGPPSSLARSPPLY